MTAGIVIFLLAWNCQVLISEKKEKESTTDKIIILLCLESEI